MCGQGYYAARRRWWAANKASSTRLDAPDLLKMWVRCDLTVFSLMADRSAISLLV